MKYIDSECYPLYIINCAGRNILYKIYANDAMFDQLTPKIMAGIHFLSSLVFIESCFSHGHNMTLFFQIALVHLVVCDMFYHDMQIS